MGGAVSAARGPELDRPEPLVGRELELRVLEAAAAAAAAGKPRVVLIEGAAGIGKTALLRSFVAALSLPLVLWASGDELETTLTNGVVRQLTDGLGAGAYPAMADTSTGSTVGADPLVVGAALLEMFSGRARDAPLVVVIDDAHWADTSSLQAITFALRRLRTDPVLVLLGARNEDLGRLPPSLRRVLAGETGASLQLRGLDESAIAALCEQQGLGPMTPRASHRLREHTGGHPLHIRALLAEIGPELLADTGDRPLPAPRALSPLILARLASCTAASQRLVLAASILGQHSALGLAARLGEVDDPLAALDEVVGAGLVAPLVPGGREVVFSHPLVRAAVYHDLAAARRAALHARAAELVEPAVDRLRHCIAAAGTEDDAVAAEAAAMAEAQAERGSWASAAGYFGDASKLSTSRGHREQWALARLESLFLGGETGEVAPLIAQAEAFPPSPYRSLVLGELALATGRAGDAELLLVAGWRLCQLPNDAPVAARLAAQLAIVIINQGRANETVEWARRALALAPEGPAATVNPQLMLVLALGMSGRAAEGLAEVGWLAERVVEPGPRVVDAVLARGVLQLWCGDLQAAGEDLAVAAEAARTRSSSHGWIMSLYYRAECEYRLGRWDEAITHAELAVSVAQDADLVWTYALTHAVAAFPLAGRGAWEGADAHVRAASDAAVLLGDGASQLWAAVAAARVAQARGDHAAGLSALAPLTGIHWVEGLHEPGIQPWELLYAEALIGAGRLEDADQRLSAVEAHAGLPPGPLGRQALSRVRGRLFAEKGMPTEAEAAFRAGLAGGEGGSPFEEALLRLALGGLLRRKGKRRAALGELQSAYGYFEQLGALPFLDRCERELKACGLVPGPRGQAHRARLSPQELAVATLVASGMTNPQVAAELIVSVKTIEFHLGNVYAKLGVSSRNRLAAVLPSSGPDASSGAGVTRKD